jgi:hypothetical protein
MLEFNNKLVAIINKDLEPGVAMNALAHLSLGMGSFLGIEKLHIDNYYDGESNLYPSISNMPYIILRGKSSEIKKAIINAKEQNITYNIFLDTMTGGTYLEQQQRTKDAKLEQLVFYGCILFGSQEKVSQITRKFSLWK